MTLDSGPVTIQQQPSSTSSGVPVLRACSRGEYVECGVCNGTYKPEVLHRMLPPTT